MGTEEQCAIQPGQTLAGRFRVLRLVGEGGMATVWEATELDGGRRVALKILHQRYVQEEELVERFLREARAAADGWYSAHVVEVYDALLLDDGCPVLVMEFLDGRPLSALLVEEGRLEPERAVDLIIQTCGALAEVHRQGVIHRDIKPENIFVTHLRDGSEWVKLLDFGVAKLANLGHDANDLTCTGCTLGTPQYMAPEQLLAEELDPRADIYSAGVVLYELLTGVQPFDEAQGLQDLLVMVVGGGVKPLRHHRPELSPRLEAVVHRAFSIELGDRYPDAFAFAEALQPLSSPAGAPADHRPTVPSLNAAELLSERRISMAPTRMFSRPPIAESGGDGRKTVLFDEAALPPDQAKTVALEAISPPSPPSAPEEPAAKTVMLPVVSVEPPGRPGEAPLSFAAQPPIVPAPQPPPSSRRSSKALWLLVAALVTLLGVGFGLIVALSWPASGAVAAPGEGPPIVK